MKNLSPGLLSQSFYRILILTDSQSFLFDLKQKKKKIDFLLISIFQKLQETSNTGTFLWVYGETGFMGNKPTVKPVREATSLQDSML